jgi:hypothetical protein
MLLDSIEKWGEGAVVLQHARAKTFVSLSPLLYVLSAGRRPFAFLFNHSLSLKCKTSKMQNLITFCEIIMGIVISCISKFE